jgi:hypothetical protein
LLQLPFDDRPDVDKTVSSIMKDSTAELMMSTRNSLADRVTQLREQREKLDNTISTLEGKIELLDELLAKAASLPISMAQHNKPDSTEPLVGLGKYAKVPMMEAVEDVIHRFGEDGIGVTEICDKMKADGFPGSEHLYSSVYVTCKRLVKKGKAAALTGAGRKLYTKISAAKAAA